MDFTLTSDFTPRLDPGTNKDFYFKYQRDLLQEGAGRAAREEEGTSLYLSLNLNLLHTHIIAKPSISLALVQELIQYMYTKIRGPFRVFNSNEISQVSNPNLPS